MIITAAKIHDGYVEQKLMFVSTSAPILKLRAVRNFKGEYEPIVRDYATGVRLVSGDVRYVNLKDCLRAAEHLAINFITDNIEKVVPF